MHRSMKCIEKQVNPINENQVNQSNVLDTAKPQVFVAARKVMYLVVLVCSIGRGIEEVADFRLISMSAISGCFFSCLHDKCGGVHN